MSMCQPLPDGSGKTQGSRHASPDGSRLQQQIGGTLTVVVAVLFGLAYAVIYARASHRFPGRTDLGSSLSLAALAFAVVVVMPALMLPANPPAVGDPATVSERTLAYVLVILLSVLAVGAVFAVEKVMVSKATPAEWRWLITSAAAAAAVAVVLIVVPSVERQVPPVVPAALIWEFRIGSFAQLAGMWAAIGIVHGVLAPRIRSRSRSTTSQTVLA